MRIGIDVRLWNESGVGRYIRNLVEQLQILDHRNEYVLFVRSKDLAEVKSQKSKVKSNNWKIVIADIRWHTIDEQLRFPPILNRENLDLVHFSYFSAPIFYNRPFVVTIHDLILHHFPTGEASTLPPYFYNLKLIGYKFVISNAARRAEKIITVSNATKSEVVDHLGVSPHKVVVTHEGVDQQIRNPIRQLTDEIRNKFKILNSKIINRETNNYFLYVGNAYPHKNLERLLEAFNLFCHPDPPAGGEGSPEALYSASWDSSSVSRRTQNDTKLILVGKEDYFYKRLKEKVRSMNLERSVLFYGEVSDEELSALYKNALALVMPSLMEGFGLPALEAMANKCLVLASDIAALKEICGNAALYFDPHNIDDIRKSMENVCFNDLSHFRKNIKDGFERTEAFSWEKMARETLGVYESILPIDF